MKDLATTALALAMLGAAAGEPDLQLSRADSRPTVQASAQNFSGQAQVEMLFTPAGPDRTSAKPETFSPNRDLLD